MDYTTLPIRPAEGKALEPGAVTSLYETLRQLSDARRGQGKRYELALVLCLLVLAKMAGQTSLSGATDWIRHRAAALADHFGLVLATWDIRSQNRRCVLGKSLASLILSSRRDAWCKKIENRQIPVY